VPSVLSFSLCEKSFPHPSPPPLTPTAPSPILPLHHRAKGVKVYAQIPQDAMAAEDYGYAAAAQGEGGGQLAVRAGTRARSAGRDQAALFGFYTPADAGHLVDSVDKDAFAAGGALPADRGAVPQPHDRLGYTRGRPERGVGDIVGVRRADLARAGAGAGAVRF